ncbi:MAG: DNA replication/repair protein RecF [Spirochaetia bacterium]|nr:DNA replication/repair protein RecF [Spirochaetia bacterium]
MNLKTLRIQNFRTYDSLELEFNTRLSFITGENAVGKTNILEAIGILSVGKSFRGAADGDMVRQGTSAYYVAGSFQRAGLSSDVEVACELSNSHTKRRIKVNSKVAANRSALLGNLVTVVFSPLDIMIVEGGPAPRRRFLDLVLSSHDGDYLQNLLAYNRALRQRNTLLKQVRERKIRLDDVESWDAAITPYAVRIIETRLNFMREFTPILDASIERISNSKDRLEARLLLSVPEELDFRQALRKRLVRDAATTHTSVGPHRHLLEFTTHGRDILNYGSQGQKRSLVLALRIAQFEYLKRRLGFAPVLLIDDVLRELDTHRSASFIKLLHECGQALFTTPDPAGIAAMTPSLQSEISVYKVTEPGVVLREQ